MPKKKTKIYFEKKTQIFPRSERGVYARNWTLLNAYTIFAMHWEMENKQIDGIDWRGEHRKLNQSRE